MVSYSKHLYATVLKACTTAVDSLNFDQTRDFERKWFHLVDGPSVSRVRWQNEVMEFLGDGILNACITAEICTSKSAKGSPSMLSMLKSVLTSNILFASITSTMIRQLGFPRHRLNGFLNIPSEHPLPTKSFADAFETVIGKLFQDQGFAAVQQWVSTVFQPLIKAASDEYHNFRSNGQTEAQASVSTSKKRKRVHGEELKLNKRPKFMVVFPKIPVIVDAGSGPDASWIQKMASALERRIRRNYTNDRDAFLRQAIGDVSRTCGIVSQKTKLKSSIAHRLLEHGKKYIRMMLAINDSAEDYPDTDEEPNEPEPSSSVRNPTWPTVTEQALGKYMTPIKLRKESKSVPPTPLDLEIQEIELIDLVGDSDEETEGCDSDDDEIEILSRNPALTDSRGVDYEVIDLISSSDEDVGSDEARSPRDGSPSSEGEVAAQLEGGSSRTTKGKGREVYSGYSLGISQRGGRSEPDNWSDNDDPYG